MYQEVNGGTARTNANDANMAQDFYFSLCEDGNTSVFFLKQNHLIRSQEEVQEEVQEVPHLSAQSKSNTFGGPGPVFRLGQLECHFNVRPFY